MSLFEKILNKLTDNYSKEPDGLIGKVLHITINELELIRKELNKIEVSRKIDSAKGLTLDYHGRDVGAERLGFNDVDYRRFIGIKIIANRSGGEIETLNEVLPVFMKSAFISVKETWNLEGHGNEPAALVIVYDDDKLLGELATEYEETESDPWFLTGVFRLDGERFLDGGIISLEATLQDRLRSIDRMKRDIKTIVAGGVRVYFAIPFEVVSQMKIEQNAELFISNLSSSEISVTQKVGQPITNLVYQAPVVRLDGTYFLDGSFYLDAKKDFAVHDVSVVEVSA